MISLFYFHNEFPQLNVYIALFQTIARTGIFDDNIDELSVWLRQLQDTNDQSAAVEFLESVIFKVCSLYNIVVRVNCSHGTQKNCVCFEGDEGSVHAD